MRSSGVALVLLSLAAPSAAQSRVWIVDGDGGPDVDTTWPQGAVDLASDGDVIVLRASAVPYPSPLEIAGKSLTIQGEGGPVMRYQFSFPSLPYVLAVSQVPAGGSVVVRGVRFEGSATWGGILDPGNTSLWSNAGSVHFEDCSFEADSGSGMSAAGCASVTLTRCELEGGLSWHSWNGGFVESTGLEAHSSNVFLFDSIVRGGRGNANQEAGIFSSPTQGSIGLRLNGGALFASGAEIAGGAGGEGGVPCALAQPQDGGDALVMEGDQPVAHILATALAGGLHGEPFGSCGPVGAQNGATVVLGTGALVPLFPAPRSMRADSPVTAGAGSLVQTYEGEPGDAAFLLYSTALTPGLYVDGLHGSLHLAPGFVALFRGIVPPGGELVVQDPVPPLGGGHEGFALPVQGAFLGATEVVLAGPSVVSLLAPGI